MKKLFKRIVSGAIVCAGLWAGARFQAQEAAAQAAGTASVTLAWQLSTATNIANQTMSYGVQSGNYTSNITLGKSVVQFQITNLVLSTTYYFAVKCTDVNNLSSAYSTQLQYTTTNAPPQNLPPPAPTGLKVISVP